MTWQHCPLLAKLLTFSGVSDSREACIRYHNSHSWVGRGWNSDTFREQLCCEAEGVMHFPELCVPHPDLALSSHQGNNTFQICLFYFPSFNFSIMEKKNDGNPCGARILLYQPTEFPHSTWTVTVARGGRWQKMGGQYIILQHSSQWDCDPLSGRLWHQEQTGTTKLFL